MTKTPPSLKSRALDFLARRDHSYRELYTKLTRYSDDLDAICQILDDLVTKKFINDERFIESFVNSKSCKYGSLKIKHLLHDKVANNNLINQVIAEQNLDEVSTAYQIWQRKYRHQLPQDVAEKAKQIRFLLSRGFSMGIVNQVFSRANAEQIE